MNVIEFFSKRLSKRILTLKSLYDFIVSDLSGIQNSENDSNLEELELLDLYFEHQHLNLQNNSNEQDESVFRQLYIPRSLNELPDVERIFKDMNIINSTEVRFMT